jgi:hypothetical protein
VLIALLSVVAGVAPQAQGRKFYDDDPLMREPETQNAAGVQSWDINLIIDLTINLFAPPGDKTPNVRARNINTIDEVPDSNWFTNRIGSKPITVDQAVNGIFTDPAPAPGRFQVVGPKAAGFAPGFTMRDSTNTLWFVSFDAKGFPEAATGAISVANKIFWTLGYWQVQNQLIAVRRDQIDIAETAKITPPNGKTRPMRLSDIDDVFARAEPSADGSYRAIAGRGLPGKVLGGFRYYGTRPDDPNDIVPHEHRRELRALKVFGAWTNLVDMKAGNTLDTLVTENGKSVVRHYLQDVGSTFGTGANGPREYDEGFEHLLELGLAKKRFFLLGFPTAPWMTADYQDNYAIGRFEFAAFDPTTWKPRVPTTAFLNARADDNFWAARRVAAFTDEMIRAIVKTGQYSRPTDEALLADMLIGRRDKIAAAYLNAINPLVDVTLSTDGRLAFKNAAVDAGVGKAPAGGYRASFASFDNATRASAPISTPVTTSSTELNAPAGLPSAGGSLVKVSITAVSAEQASWNEAIDVYFRRTTSGWQLVGLDRLPGLDSQPASKQTSSW